MIDRRTRPNWKLVHVPNRVYMNPNSRTRQRIFLPGIAHLVTEGMCEKHGHPYEFQIVIDAPLRDMANILAEFAAVCGPAISSSLAMCWTIFWRMGHLFGWTSMWTFSSGRCCGSSSRMDRTGGRRMRSVATDATCRMCRHRCCCIRIFGERKIERIKLEEELQHV